MDLSNELSCEAGSFSHHCNPHRFFQSEVLRLYFLMLEPWVVQSVCSLDVPPSLSARECETTRSTCCPLHHPIHQLLPCHESSVLHCPSPPLLPVWMNVSSLTPWLSDFHTVQFSGSSGYFLFLNLLLSFGLSEEAKNIYVHLHLGQKSYYYLHISRRFSCII